MNEEIKTLINKCNKGDGESCNELGLMYDQGEDVDRDTSKAFEYFEKACMLNNTNGCNSLGDAYKFGIGVRQSNSKALELFKKSCDLDGGFGCTAYEILEIAIAKNKGEML